MIHTETITGVLLWGHTITGRKIVSVTVTTPLYLSSSPEGYTRSTTPRYGTWTGAEQYFSRKVRTATRDWYDAEYDQQIAALDQATAIINNLNFVGTPVSETQALHFPTVEHGTPDNIAKACYEIALRLLSGIDPETEADNISVTAQGYAGGRSTFDRSFAPLRIMAGVPSNQAWLILRPYLKDFSTFRISRG